MNQVTPLRQLPPLYTLWQHSQLRSTKKKKIIAWPWLFNKKRMPELSKTEIVDTDLIERRHDRLHFVRRDIGRVS